ncbi:MAG: RNA polymerase sigma factor [Candidatus Aminicenantes bacterium]|nr:RNA polymerase sigma factor [Candidatus Aminicenantes bacterium]
MDLEATIRNCLEGSQTAWRDLVDAYARRIYNMAYQFCGGREEAEDRTQEVFLKLHGALPKYDFGKNFTAWFLTLAKNHLIDEYRRTKWERTQRDEFDERVLSQSAGGGPEERLADREVQALVWEGLDRLSPDMRMVIIMRDLQGQSYEEIAIVLGLPLGTVKSRVNRARIQLARVLKERRGEVS